MSNREFKVGDKCRIRQWDDMAAEFGVNEIGRINTKYFDFTGAMKPLCGMPFTIKEYSLDGSYASEERIEYTNLELGRWFISSDMLEYDEPGFQPVSEEELSSLPGF